VLAQDGEGQRAVKGGEALSPWITYPAALATVGGAALVLRLLAPLVGSTVPVSLFVLAVTLSAWLGGAGPGLLATVASLIVAHLFSLKPDAVLPITRASYAVRFALFALAGTAISVISEKKRRAAARAE
jgi:K+-sensing histidine kinase KdpD